MITFEDCTLSQRDPSHMVTFNYTKKVKTAKCKCGEEWKPKSPNDSICKHDES